jgi:hypothetical protein
MCMSGQDALHEAANKINPTTRTGVDSKCANKIKVFVWLLLMDRLNIRNLLRRKKFKLQDTLGIPSSQNEPMCMFFLLHGGLHRDWRWVQHPFLEGPMAAWAERARSCPKNLLHGTKKNCQQKDCSGCNAARAMDSGYPW